MSNSARRGFTLPEILIAIVVIGVGLAGVLLAFQATTRGSADPLIERQMQAIAEGLLEEALSKPYTPVAGGASAGCARDGFNDVDDYNGYASTGICTINGAAVAGLERYNVAVSVGGTVVSGVAGKRVQVTVTRGSDTLRLVGLRTGYGA